LVRRFGVGVALAIGLGLVATVLGIVLAYDSYYWTSSHRGLPVSFFVVVLVVAEFVLSSFIHKWRRARAPVAVHSVVADHPEGWH
jgi:zinc/manganese transport system permease protein